MTTYIDAGWTGSPVNIEAALTSYGYQINADNSVALIDPTKVGSIVAVTGYRVLDGIAYILIRSTVQLVLPSGITALGPDHTSAISGVFMSDGTTPPSVIQSLVFFNRFTPTETAAIWAAAVGNPAIGVGLINGLAAGTVNLNSPTVIAWVGALVSASVITAARQTVVLTP